MQLNLLVKYQLHELKRITRMIDPIKDINEATNIALIAQNALGFALPPFIPFRDTVRVKKSQSVEASEELKSKLSLGFVENTNWQVPLMFQLAGQIDFDFPVDPIISLSSKNIITRRYVNKSGMRGTIKERWSQDDWDITISGVIIEPDADAMKNILLELRKYCESPKSVDVKCMVLSATDITKISIESLDLPFTKGVENQTFVIKAYSDNEYTLLTGI